MMSPTSSNSGRLAVVFSHRHSVQLTKPNCFGSVGHCFYWKQSVAENPEFGVESDRASGVRMERSDSSSDEDDDRRNLILQNDTKHSLSPRSAAFHVQDDGHDFRSNTRPPRFFFPKFTFSFFNKWYFLAFSLPLVILLLYFSTDAPSVFSAKFSPAYGNIDSLGARMRESELKALYMLKQQQLGLFSLWNHSFTVHSNFTSSFTSNSTSAPDLQKDYSQFLAKSSSFFDDLKLALLEQISLNKEIQQVLLSSHRPGNLSNELEDNSFSGGFEIDDTCGKVDQRSSQRRTMDWKPKYTKYLFAICVSGQMSNHLICLEKHMFFAALLNRILVIPSSKVDYPYSKVLDIEQINTCLGRKVVISFEEFAQIKKSHVHIDRFLCYFSKPDPCFLDEEHVKKLKNLGVSMTKLESAWAEDTKNPQKRTAQDVQSKFSSNDDVIAVGDIYFADVEQDWVTQPGGPLAHHCKTLMEPARLIKLTAQRFIQTFLGKNFVAIHFRRHGFLKFCNAKHPSCFYPIPQAAECITRMIEKANAPVIYLSTDAAESETDLLQSLIVVNGKTIPLVKRPPRNSAEKWDALLYRHGFEGDSQVDAMLDKAICAMSSVFIGAPGSTFTEDILRLRKDWGSASRCDEYLCRGEDPNFVATNE